LQQAHSLRQHRTHRRQRVLLANHQHLGTQIAQFFLELLEGVAV
jgi:hypothetical protein